MGGTATSKLQKVRAGSGVSWIGAPVGADLLAPALLKGWQEWYEKKWVFRSMAGVAAMSSYAKDKGHDRSMKPPAKGENAAKASAVEFAKTLPETSKAPAAQML